MAAKYLFLLAHLNRSLRSSRLGLLFVPQASAKSGEGAFSHHGATLWNKLPADQRSVKTLSSFESLKTLLFFHASADLQAFAFAWKCLIHISFLFFDLHFSLYFIFLPVKHTEFTFI